MGNRRSKTLAPEEFAFLERNTKFSRKEIKHWHKSFIKDCPNGLLSEETFKKVYRNFFPDGNADSFCQHVFRSFDREGKGTITFSEFLKAVNITMNKVDPREKLEWAFVLYDVDGNGKIERKEMEQIIEAMYDMLGSSAEGLKPLGTPKHRASKIFKILDKNHDDVVTKLEFIQGCLRDKYLFRMLTTSGTDQFTGAFTPGSSSASAADASREVTAFEALQESQREPPVSYMTAREPQSPDTLAGEGRRKTKKEKSHRRSHGQRYEIQTFTELGATAVTQSEQQPALPLAQAPEEPDMLERKESVQLSVAESYSSSTLEKKDSVEQMSKPVCKVANFEESEHSDVHKTCSQTKEGEKDHDQIPAPDGQPTSDRTANDSSVLAKVLSAERTSLKEDKEAKGSREFPHRTGPDAAGNELLYDTDVAASGPPCVLCSTPTGHVQAPLLNKDSTGTVEVMKIKKDTASDDDDYTTVYLNAPLAFEDFSLAGEKAIVVAAGEKEALLNSHDVSSKEKEFTDDFDSCTSTPVNRREADAADDLIACEVRKIVENVSSSDDGLLYDRASLDSGERDTRVSVTLCSACSAPKISSSDSLKTGEAMSTECEKPASTVTEKAKAGDWVMERDSQDGGEADTHHHSATGESVSQNGESSLLSDSSSAGAMRSLVLKSADTAETESEIAVVPAEESQTLSVGTGSANTTGGEGEGSPVKSEEDRTNEHQLAHSEVNSSQAADGKTQRDLVPLDEMKTVIGKFDVTIISGDVKFEGAQQEDHGGDGGHQAEKTDQSETATHVGNQPENAASNVNEAEVITEVPNQSVTATSAVNQSETATSEADATLLSAADVEHTVATTDTLGGGEDEVKKQDNADTGSGEADATRRPLLEESDPSDTAVAQEDATELMAVGIILNP